MNIYIYNFFFYSDKCSTMEVNRYRQKFNKQHCLKYFLLCSTEERNSYRFGTTWGWVNDDIIFIFGWTIPLKGQWIYGTSSCQCILDLPGSHLVTWIMSLTRVWNSSVYLGADRTQGPTSNGEGWKACLMLMQDANTTMMLSATPHRTTITRFEINVIRPRDTDDRKREYKCYLKSSMSIILMVHTQSVTKYSAELGLYTFF